MARTAFSNIEIARQFYAVPYTGCDGFPAQKIFDAIIVEVNGVQYLLENMRWMEDKEEGERWVVAAYNADEMLVAIRRKGSVDLSKWIELEPQPSLEERFAQYAEEEQLERMGLR